MLRQVSKAFNTIASSMDASLDVRNPDGSGRSTRSGARWLAHDTAVERRLLRCSWLVTIISFSPRGVSDDRLEC